MRQENGKRQATMGFIAMGCYTIAAGDSYNDLGMIQAANRGHFFAPLNQLRRNILIFRHLPTSTNWEIISSARVS